MNNLDKQYQDLLQDILDNGTKKGDRTGTGTLSVFGRQIRHKMSEGFPLITTKKMPFKTIATELIWFLKGDTNIKYLVDNGCNIWNGDAYKNFSNKLRFARKMQSGVSDPDDIPELKELTLEEFVEKIKTDDIFAKKWGELGPVYGRQWRKWSAYNEYDAEPELVDQIRNLVEDLKSNPDSRRLMVNAWNVGEIDQMVLPPCHYGFQVYTRHLSLDERQELWLMTQDQEYIDMFYDENVMEYSRTSITHNYLSQKNIPERAISLMWNQRSVDTFLGLPFNIASYGLLLEILAKEVNMVPDELIGNLGDTHLYLNHLEQAKEQIGREYNNDERVALFLESGMDAVMDSDVRKQYFDAIPKRTREGYALPKVEINDSWKFGSSSPVFADKLKLDMFKLVGYRSHDNIKAPLSN